MIRTLFRRRPPTNGLPIEFAGVYRCEFFGKQSLALSEGALTLVIATAPQLMPPSDTNVGVPNFLSLTIGTVFLRVQSSSHRRYCSDS